jgi:hypothetical protein
LKKILLLFTFITLLTLQTLQTNFAQVTQEWVATYSGGAQNLGARCMALDTNGNIYVTGIIIQPSTSNDIATVKYNTNGVQQWVAIFNSSNNGPDLVSAITTDMSGYIYLTGTNYTPQGGNYAFITVKYNTNGVQQWLANYIGPYGTGESNDIAVDKQGNVYITGYTINNDPNASRYFITIKYNSSGAQQWVRTYGAAGQFGSYALGGRANTLDDSANVYVTGNIQGGGSPYFTTIKYNSNGVQQWVVSELSIYGSGKRICLDNSRNVITAGYAQISSQPYFVTVKYNNNGVNQWVSTIYCGVNATVNGLTTDNSGNVYIGSTMIITSSHFGIATIKYNQNGVQQWLQTYTGSGNNGYYGGGLVLDSLSNVYVTGTSTNANNNYDYTTIKYNVNGTQEWLITYNSTGNLDDYSQDIKIDKNRNIFVTGGSNSAFVTIKYSQPNSIKKISTEVPSEFNLSQNYPNPFNPSTKIKFDIPDFPLMKGARGMSVRLTIYDLLGREVATLVHEPLQPGTYEVEFDGTNYPSGVYFYRLTAGNYTNTKKLVLLK